MNRILYVFAAASLFAAANANASESDAEVIVDAEPRAASESRMNRVSLGVLSIGFGQLPIEYERAFSKNVSIALGAQLFYPGVGMVVRVYELGAGGTLGLRYYPWAETPMQGVWLGAEMHGKAAISYALGYGIPGIYAGGVLNGGYTWTWDNGVSFATGLGLGAQLGATTVAVGVRPHLTGHAHLGYAF